MENKAPQYYLMRYFKEFLYFNLQINFSWNRDILLQEVELCEEKATFVCLWCGSFKTIGFSHGR